MSSWLTLRRRLICPVYRRSSFQKALSTNIGIILKLLCFKLLIIFCVYFLDNEVKPHILNNFITNIVEHDISTNKTDGRIVTRFPPEPNGYLHLGHAKSINFNFLLAKAYGGVTHMRFDDTNPSKEDIEYVNSILDDVRWLVTGEKLSSKQLPEPWFGNIRFASNYFPTMYDAAEYLIENQLAYVCHLSYGKNLQFLTPNFLYLCHTIFI